MSNKDKKLLVLSSGYPNEKGDYLNHTFVKGFVDEAKHFFNEIEIVVLLPYAPKFISQLMNKYEMELKDYAYDNVKVSYKRYPFLPIWPLSKYKGKIAHLFLSKAISELINDNTVIHANFSSPAGVVAMESTKKRKNEFVLTVHEDHDWLVSEIESNNSNLIKTWRNAKAIIRVNKMDIELLRPFNDELYTIANGYNHRKFKVLDRNECRSELEISEKTKVLVNIGFYKDQKNQKLLIESVSKLPEAMKSNLKCYIIGGGPLHKELQTQIRLLNLDDVISLEGQIEQDKLPLYLNAADLFCLSSDSEGNPTVMFEALGVGIPYIGTNVGGVPEIITSEDYGLTCNSKDSQMLSEIIESGLTKKWDRNKIIEYSKQFTWKNIFLETQKHY